MKDARDWVAHLEAHLPLALSGEDPEGVHQVRVAGRRFRAYLELLGHRILRDDLRFLVRQAGRVRDLEVALGWALPQGVRGQLEAELKEVREALSGLLLSPWMGALLRALRHLPPLDKGRARKRLKRLQERLEARFLELRAEPSLEHLHAYRRTLRRVRYAKEFLGLSAKRERALQEVLGEVNDLRVLKDLLLAYLHRREDPEARSYLEGLENALEAATWRALEGLGLGFIPRG
jgi:CHAD domain-containing protein